jgi:hypothetical protein
MVLIFICVNKYYGSGLANPRIGGQHSFVGSHYVYVPKGSFMQNKFDERFLKALILIMWIVPTSFLFFLLNTIANKNYIVFVCVIFGCNVVYDISRRILAAPIESVESAIDILKSGLLAIVIFLLSFVGVYLEATEAIFPYVGVGLIWLPMYIWSLHLLSSAEKHYKAAFGNGN